MNVTGTRSLAAVAVGLLLGGMGLAERPAPALASGAIYVAPDGQDGDAGTSCASARYSVIQQAIDAAAAGSTVVVCSGTYTLTNQQAKTRHALFRINKPLTVQGEDAQLDASGDNGAPGKRVGILITHSHVTVAGMSITGAEQEGILATPSAAIRSWSPPYRSVGHSVPPIIDISVSDNTIDGNDQGWAPYNCTCGGGINLDGVAHSRVSGNQVTGNTDGIELTDEAGANHDNLVSGNLVENNTRGSGIALVSTNPEGAQSAYPGGLPRATGKTYPNKGGVFGDTVKSNTVKGNGTEVLNGYGLGAGVLLHGEGEGVAVYANRVIANAISGNGLAGVAAHFDYYGGMGGQYVSRNSVIGNVIGQNNLAGDGLDQPMTVPLLSTAGVVLLSAPRTSFVVTRNQISHDAIGVWRNPAITLPQASNTFTAVGQSYRIARRVFGFANCEEPGEAWSCSQNSSSVAFAGVVVANGLRTTIYFKYGTNSGNLTDRTPPKKVGAGETAKVVRSFVDGVDGSQTYYFQLIAKNSAGTFQSGISEIITSK